MLYSPKSQPQIFAFPHVLSLNDKWQNAAIAAAAAAATTASAGATKRNSLISKYHTQSLIIA